MTHVPEFLLRQRNQPENTERRPVNRATVGLVVLLICVAALSSAMAVAR